MRKIKLDKFTLREMAKNMSKVYPFSADRIYDVILQVRSLDLTLDIIETCLEYNVSLDYGVWCYLKHKDENKQSIFLEI